MYGALNLLIDASEHSDQIRKYWKKIYSLFALCLQKPTDELGRSYVSFMRISLDQIRQKVADELYIITLFEVSMINDSKKNR